MTWEGQARAAGVTRLQAAFTHDGQVSVNFDSDKTAYVRKDIKALTIEGAFEKYLKLTVTQRSLDQVWERHAAEAKLEMDAILAAEGLMVSNITGEVVEITKPANRP